MLQKIAISMTSDDWSSKRSHFMIKGFKVLFVISEVGEIKTLVR
jgi:hypothetical protein